MTAPEPQETPVEGAEQVAQAILVAQREGKRRDTQTLMEALLFVQGELPKVEKTGENPAFKQGTAKVPSKYMELDGVYEAILPVLNRNGLVWLTFPGFATHEGRYEPLLNYGLYHAGTGGKIEGHMLLLCARDDPQGQGAALTYAKRQALTAALSLSAESDDDGNRAADAKRASVQRQADARSGARILDEAQRTAMLNAVRESGLDVADTMEKCGIDPDGDVTAAQSRQVRALIEAAKPVEGSS